MIKMNPRTNLLRAEEYNYALQDRETPNLFRSIFQYGEVPKITFNNTLVPLDMPVEIFITDTTFRDGQQSRRPYTVKQILHIYQELHRLGGEKGLIRQSEFFLYTKKDQEAVYQCLELGYQFPEITSWIRASKKDFQLVKEMQLNETGILVSCSDYHIYNKMHMTRKQALDHYLGVVKDCIETGVRPRCHLEDITRADFYQFVVPFVNALQELGKESGVPVKIRACDTLGYGVGYPGSMLPRSVPGIVAGLHRHSRVPHELLEWHGHNDFYRSVANAVNAWLYGASAVNCSLFGIGERTGNTPTEAMVFEYAQLKGTLNGMDTTVITDLAEYFTSEIGYRIPPRTPFVGRDFNTTRAGIHADGIMKDQEIYNIFDTEKLLNRSPRIVVSNTAGTSGVAYWINTRFALVGTNALKKDAPLVKQVKDWVDACYNEGRSTSISDEELEEITMQYAKELGVTL